MTLSKKLKKVGGRKTKPRRKEALWKGPEVDGITQSMLSRFLVCRERFRLLVVEGLRPVDTFDHKPEYGQMWHVCEEAWAKYSRGTVWEISLRKYAQELCKKYPLQQEQIQHWYNVCKVQFPIYIDYWAKHKDVKSRTPLLQEHVFDVAYRLPSGRVVRLRGKWDGVDLIGKGKNAGIWLQENKTKGDVNEEQTKRQLQFDLQTMIYLVALHEVDWTVRFDKSWDRLFGKGWHGTKSIGPPSPIQGVNYNVVRRPLSGGKYSIRQHKPTKAKPSGESTQEFYQRLGDLITLDREWFFMRWKVIITVEDIERFKREFLNPILEDLCDWWDWIVYQQTLNNPRVDPFAGRPEGKGRHWRTPYGFYNILAEGGSSELDEYLATGSELGLERTDKLFKELE